MPPPEIRPSASGTTLAPRPYTDDFFGLELTPNVLPRRGGTLGVELIPFAYALSPAAAGQVAWIAEQIGRAQPRGHAGLERPRDQIVALPTACLQNLRDRGPSGIQFQDPQFKRLHLWM